MTHNQTSTEVEARIGNWKLISVRRNEKSQRVWLCACDCGKTKEVMEFSLKSGNSTGCGHNRLEKLSLSIRSHGMSGTRFYSTWEAMRARCRVNGTAQTRYHGDKGIKVCKRWESFDKFYADMYESYEKHFAKYGPRNTSIDRIDAEGDYKPSNCRWATWKTQNNKSQHTSHET